MMAVLESVDSIVRHTDRRIHEIKGRETTEHADHEDINIREKKIESQARTQLRCLKGDLAEVHRKLTNLESKL